MIRKRRERWRVNALPLWLAQQLPEDALADAGYCEHLLRTLELKRRTGRIASRLHRIWPQQLGFRVALKLLERGRVAFGVFLYEEDTARWMRSRGCIGDVRMTPADLLAGMRAVGGTIEKRAPVEFETDDSAPERGEVQR